MLDSLMYKQRDGHESFQAFQAFWCYLPHTDDVRGAVLNAARTRGLQRCDGASYWNTSNCAESDLAEVIRLSLASNDPNVVRQPGLTAQEHPSDDVHAKADRDCPGNRAREASSRRRAAISAIAYHRTDEGVAALKTLAERSGPEAFARRRPMPYATHTGGIRSIPRRWTRLIRQSLSRLPQIRGILVRFAGVYEIASTRTPEGVKAVKMLLADPNAQVPMSELDLGVRTIRDLLRDNDPNVRA